MSEMLKIENIRKIFNPGTINEKVALDGVNLTLEEGEFVTVIGGNGAGKSTTLNAVAGVWPVDSGKIYIGGEDVTKLSEHRRAQYLGHGNRLIMMHEGKVILNIAGEDKKKLTVGDLLHQFEKVSGEEFASDKALLS